MGDEFLWVGTLMESQRSAEPFYSNHFNTVAMVALVIIVSHKDWR